MRRRFNTTGLCVPNKHYMVDLNERLEDIRELVDDGAYMSINQARQYGKTTTLNALANALAEDYLVMSLDFQAMENESFENESTFSVAFLFLFIRRLEQMHILEEAPVLLKMKTAVNENNTGFKLIHLFNYLLEVCRSSIKPIVLIIDEVDSATNNQVFLDFLAQLRNYFLERESIGTITFQSVILASVFDVKNLKQKIRSKENHKMNSPWNIAADFDVNLSFTPADIAGMLREFEADNHSGMNIEEMAGLIYDYTAGYPFLVSRLCQLLDEKISKQWTQQLKKDPWTKLGFDEAIRIVLLEKNTLFESLIGKLTDYSELNTMLQTLLFTGKSIVYNSDNVAIDMATMLGFIKNNCGTVAIANRIFETSLYNLYLSTSGMQDLDIYKASLQDKNQFILNGQLNMRLILEKFVTHFDDLYHDRDETFLEEEGRKYFLLFLRPIINGTGNYYIESRSRGLRRTDVIIDYCGEQHILELKLWHGEEYNSRGERQLVEYLNDYHTNKGYMLSFNFNKKKQIGLKEIVVGEKILVEAVV